MKKFILIFLVLLLTFQIFTDQFSIRRDVEKMKQKIMEVEKKFAKMAADKGIGEAFLCYAAEDAVIMRNNKIYKGKAEIKEYFDSSGLSDIKLQWKPDFIDVSSSGDLAYTYGKFTFSAKDKSGKLLQSDGVFHTVWKKQTDGKWKFVWD